MNNTIIHKYIKNKNKTIGVIIAVKVNENEVGVGWSKCATTRGDIFDKERGVQIAAGRAFHFGGQEPIPENIIPEVRAMATRAQKYFKGCNVIYHASAGY